MNALEPHPAPRRGALSRLKWPLYGLIFLLLFPLFGEAWPLLAMLLGALIYTTSHKGRASDHQRLSAPTSVGQIMSWGVIGGLVGLLLLAVAVGMDCLEEGVVLLLLAPPVGVLLAGERTMRIRDRWAAMSAARGLGVVRHKGLEVVLEIAAPPGLRLTSRARAPRHAPYLGDPDFDDCWCAQPLDAQAFIYLNAVRRACLLAEAPRLGFKHSPGVIRVPLRLYGGDEIEAAERLAPLIDAPPSEGEADAALAAALRVEPQASVLLKGMPWLSVARRAPLIDACWPELSWFERLALSEIPHEGQAARWRGMVEAPEAPEATRAAALRWLIGAQGFAAVEGDAQAEAEAEATLLRWLDGPPAVQAEALMGLAARRYCLTPSALEARHACWAEAILGMAGESWCPALARAIREILTHAGLQDPPDEATLRRAAAILGARDDEVTALNAALEGASWAARRALREAMAQIRARHGGVGGALALSPTQDEGGLSLNSMTGGLSHKSDPQ